MCGCEVTPSLDSVRRGRGCAVCAQTSRAEKLRAPADKAIASMVSGGYEPLEPYPGGKDKQWRCRCMTCGREGAPTLGNTRQGKRRPWCAGNRVSPDEAVAVMRGLGAEPLASYPGAHTPWRCRCNKCGNEITPTYSNARKFSSHRAATAPHSDSGTKIQPRFTCSGTAGTRLSRSALHLRRRSTTASPTTDVTDGNWRAAG